jgi:hypothetical protein
VSSGLATRMTSTRVSLGGLGVSLNGDGPTSDLIFASKYVTVVAF